MTTRKNTRAALHWIVTLLRKQKIPFQITGGFAARLYGSQRPLADIDIEVPDTALPLIEHKTAQYSIRKLTRFKDKHWDVLLITVRYQGQEIDICGASTERIYDAQRKRWRKQRIDLRKAQRKAVYGLRLPIVPLEELIEYKKLLGRKVDVYDVKALTAQQSLYKNKLSK